MYSLGIIFSLNECLANIEPIGIIRIIHLKQVGIVFCFKRKLFGINFTILGKSVQGRGCDKYQQHNSVKGGRLIHVSELILI